MFPRSFRAFAYTAPGLENLLAKELTGILKRKVELSQDGCEISHINETEIWKVCSTTRIANGLRIRIGQAKETSKFALLNRYIRTLPWEYFLPLHYNPKERKLSVSIHSTCHQSKLFHSDAVSERIEKYLEKKKLIPDQEKDELQEIANKYPHLLHKTPKKYPKEPIKLSIHARLVEDVAQMSLDVGGEVLSRRGYRIRTTEAPIRENLAAACFDAMEFKSNTLWDPFCGSGTLICEGLLKLFHNHFPHQVAINQLTSLPRIYSFQYWNHFPVKEHKEWNQDYIVPSKRKFHEFLKNPIVPFQFFASDISEAATRATRLNWESLTKQKTLGKGASIEYMQGDFEKIASKVLEKSCESPILFSNLPYGVRLVSHLNSIYNRLNKMLKENPSWFSDVYILDGSADNHFLSIASSHGVQWESILQFSNGGTGVKLLKLKKKGLVS